ncbi:hypothetical protein BD413DRAFT_674902 [Trametes elegans]|nr:hypothetical protein BD413DRAFT_674902 [Trametes elegans]
MPSPNVMLWSIDEAGPHYIYRKPCAPRAPPPPVPELEGARAKPKRAAYVPKTPKPTLADKVAHAKRAVLRSAAGRASADAYYDLAGRLAARPSAADAAAHEAKKARIAVLDDMTRLPLDWVPIPGFAEDYPRRAFDLIPVERAQEWEGLKRRAFPVEMARGADPMGPGGVRAVDVGRARKLLQII